jgi:hypothetical protein
MQRNKIAELVLGAPRETAEMAKPQTPLGYKNPKQKLPLSSYQEILNYRPNRSLTNYPRHTSQYHLCSHRQAQTQTI